MAYFPASGVRNRTDGAVTLLCKEGNSWSSSTYTQADVCAARLWLIDAKVSPFNGIHRAYSYPVRCVQELAVILYRSVIKARSAVECSDSQ